MTELKPRVMDDSIISISKWREKAEHEKVGLDLACVNLRSSFEKLRPFERFPVVAKAMSELLNAEAEIRQQQLIKSGK